MLPFLGIAPYPRKSHIILSQHSQILGRSCRYETKQLDVPSPDNQLIKTHVEILDHIKNQIPS
jgi:hypothetical protein